VPYTQLLGAIKNKFPTAQKKKKKNENITTPCQNWREKRQLSASCGMLAEILFY